MVGTFLAALILASRSYWRAEAAWHEEAHRRQEAERKEKAERWSGIATRRDGQRASFTTSARSPQFEDAGITAIGNGALPELLDLAQHVLRWPDAACNAALPARRTRALMVAEGGLIRAWDDRSQRSADVSTILNLWRLSPDGKTSPTSPTKTGLSRDVMTTGSATFGPRNHPHAPLARTHAGCRVGGSDARLKRRDR